jgi:hypothetical protein
MNTPTFPPPTLTRPTSFKEVSGHKIGDTLHEEIHTLAGFFECAPRGIVIAALYDYFRKAPFTQLDIIEEAEAWMGVPLFRAVPQDEEGRVKRYRRLLVGVNRRRYKVLTSKVAAVNYFRREVNRGVN